MDLSSVKPIRSKPSRKWVKPEEHATILANTKDQNFRDIVNFYWFTGCRSYEAYRLRLRHLELTPNYNRAVIPCEEMPLHKTENGKPRIVYIPDEAIEIVRRLTANMTDPEEFVFKTRKGKPWKRNLLNNRFERLKDTLGRRLSPYAYRHAFGTRKRAEGKIADLDLAYLMGHQDLSMLKDYYDHAEEMAEEMARKANL